VTNGGLLEVVRRDLTVSCLPDKLIDSLELDVSGLEIGDSVHIRDIAFPEGIACAEEGDLTVAVVKPPGVEIEEAVEEEIEEEMAGPEEGTAEGVDN
jgi:large subunit ribosomal protein L25